jgi:hypothetical protein
VIVACRRYYVEPPIGIRFIAWWSVWSLPRSLGADAVLQLASAVSQYPYCCWFEMLNVFADFRWTGFYLYIVASLFAKLYPMYSLESLLSEWRLISTISLCFSGVTSRNCAKYLGPFLVLVAGN